MCSVNPCAATGPAKLQLCVKRQLAQLAEQRSIIALIYIVHSGICHDAAQTQEALLLLRHSCSTAAAQLQHSCASCVAPLQPQHSCKMRLAIRLGIALFKPAL